MTDITIIDAIMGAGKSTYIINDIINNLEKRFICVVPTLSECERYSEEINGFVNLIGNHNFIYYEPKPCGGKKINGLHGLIATNKNIITTHSLIQYIDETTIELLKNSNYTLIIDECLDVCHEYKRKFSKSDLKSILYDGYAAPDEKGFLVWNEQKEKEVFQNKYQGRWDDIKRLCNLKSLMCLQKEDGTFSNEIVIWNFPVSFFDLFEKCYICTYLWNGSIQKSYFDMYNVNYKHMTLRDKKTEPYLPEKELSQRMHYFQMINLYSGNLNNIGVPKNKKENPLCVSWYKRKSKTETGRLFLTQIKKNTENYFKNIVKTKSYVNMYTTFEEYKKYIAGDYYTKGFVACNCKGTNKYRHKESLAYLINLFPPQNLVTFFASQGIVFDKDMYALSELLQWIWRSRIREGKTINLYIPSSRMRELLSSWALCKI